MDRWICIVSVAVAIKHIENRYIDCIMNTFLKSGRHMQMHTGYSYS